MRLAELREFIVHKQAASIISKLVTLTPKALLSVATTPGSGAELSFSMPLRSDTGPAKDREYQMLTRHKMT